MNFLESSKTVVGSVVTAANGTATLTLDTMGYAYASVDVVVGLSAIAAHTASSVLSVLTLTQGDTTAATASVYTVSVPAASVAVTSRASVVRLDVDLRGKSRFLKINATPSTTLPTTIVARLGKGEVGPETAADKGVLSKFSG